MWTINVTSLNTTKELLADTDAHIATGLASTASTFAVATAQSTAQRVGLAAFTHTAAIA